MLFLQGLIASNTNIGSSAIWGPLIGLIVAFMFVFFLIMLGVYIYLSLAFMAIAKKAKLSAPGLAWIPGIGPAIIAFRASKMHWWPWLLLIGMIIPIVGSIALVVFAVYSVIWSWKMFEVVKRPGYWAILAILPIVNLILYGIAAWSKN